MKRITILLFRIERFSNFYFGYANSPKTIDGIIECNILAQIRSLSQENYYNYSLSQEKIKVKVASSGSKIAEVQDIGLNNLNLTMLFWEHKSQTIKRKWFLLNFFLIMVFNFFIKKGYLPKVNNRKFRYFKFQVSKDKKYKSFTCSAKLVKLHCKLNLFNCC